MIEEIKEEKHLCISILEFKYKRNGKLSLYFNIYVFLYQNLNDNSLSVAIKKR